MDKDYVKGRAKETTGSLREVAGRAFGEKTQESKVKVQKMAIKTEAANSDLRSDLQKLWMIY